jgi:hypothetical protein
VILPTPFQRPCQLPANALPTGCVFQPPIPPKGVGTARPLEGGPNAHEDTPFPLAGLIPAPGTAGPGVVKHPTDKRMSPP